VALVAQDITPRRRAEAALAELNRVLEQRVQAAVAELHHRDQMLVNLGDAQDHGDLTPEKLKRSLKKGDLVIQKMSSTINDFRNFFRPDKARSEFSALKQVRSAVAIVEAGFEADNIAIRVDSAEDITLFGFPNEYSQVLLNLLSNARQAILAGRITARNVDGATEFRVLVPAAGVRP